MTPKTLAKRDMDKISSAFHGPIVCFPYLPVSLTPPHKWIPTTGKQRKKLIGTILRGLDVRLLAYNADLPASGGDLEGSYKLTPLTTIYPKSGETFRDPYEAVATALKKPAIVNTMLVTFIPLHVLIKLKPRFTADRLCSTASVQNVIVVHGPDNQFGFQLRIIPSGPIFEDQFCIGDHKQMVLSTNTGKFSGTCLGDCVHHCNDCCFRCAQNHLANP